VTAGELVEEHVEGDWRITRRKTSAPIRMAGFNLGQYERVRLKRNGYTLEVCANRAIEPALEGKGRAATPIRRQESGTRAGDRDPAAGIAAGSPGAAAGNRLRDSVGAGILSRYASVRRRCPR
jgi:hypothetical protein